MSFPNDVGNTYLKRQAVRKAPTGENMMSQRDCDVIPAVVMVVSVEAHLLGQSHARAQCQHPHAHSLCCVHSLTLPSPMRRGQIRNTTGEQRTQTTRRHARIVHVCVATVVQGLQRPTANVPNTKLQLNLVQLSALTIRTRTNQLTTDERESIFLPPALSIVVPGTNVLHR